MTHVLRGPPRGPGFNLWDEREIDISEVLTQKTAHNNRIATNINSYVPKILYIYIILQIKCYNLKSKSITPMTGSDPTTGSPLCPLSGSPLFGRPPRSRLHPDRVTLKSCSDKPCPNTWHGLRLLLSPRSGLVALVALVALVWDYEKLGETNISESWM